MKRIKGQMSMDDAPVIVMIIGLVFLVMATFAFVGEKYGNAIDTDSTLATVTNETGAWLNETTYTVDNSGAKNFAALTITSALNTTDNSSIGTGNFTVSGSGFTNASETNWDSIWVSYTYTYSADTASSNVTNDLQTEIGNNSSIAGIILTISLIGIVLTILIGVFVGIRRGTI